MHGVMARRMLEPLAARKATDGLVVPRHHLFVCTTLRPCVKAAWRSSKGFTRPLVAENSKPHIGEPLPAMLAPLTTISGARSATHASSAMLRLPVTAMT